LLPVGFAVPFPLPETRCALTAPFHPCRAGTQHARRSALCGTFPKGLRPRRTLSGTAYPRSPDFPPRRPFGPCRSGRPADWPCWNGAQSRLRQGRALNCLNKQGPLGARGQQKWSPVLRPAAR